MNWKEIKKKYPKALEKLVKGEFPNAKNIKTDYEDSTGDIFIETDKGSSVYYLRDLYDFFDEQGIYISVKADCSELFKKDGNKIVVWDNQVTSRISGCGDGDFKNRKKAEEDAFLEAFSILEYQLK